MNYREHLAIPLSMRFVDLLVLEIFTYPADFEKVYKLIFDEDIKVAWRAAWACQKISEKHPEWFTDTHFNELVKLVLNTNHGGLHRGCLSILNNIAKPHSMGGNLQQRFTTLKNTIDNYNSMDTAHTHNSNTSFPDSGSNCCNSIKRIHSSLPIEKTFQNVTKAGMGKCY